MCYSPESSITTFLIVLGVCVYLWLRGGNVNKTIAIILFFISLMQLIEFFIWKNLECTDTNKYISLLIPITLFLQPVMVLTTIIYFNSGRLSPTFYKTLLGIWFVTAPLFIKWMEKGFNKCTTVGPNGHLVWPYTNSPTLMDHITQNIYNLMLAAGIVTLNTKWYGIFYIALSSISYKYTKDIYGHSWGSIWCNFVNFLALGALFI